MRRYPGMRLPPGTDSLLRNELVKADRQLKQLNAAVSRSLTRTNLPVANGPGIPGSPGGLGEHNHSTSSEGGNQLGAAGFQMNAKGLWNFDDSIQSITSRVRIEPSTATQLALEIQLAANQTANAFTMKDSGGTTKFGMNSDGFIGVGTSPLVNRGVFVTVSKTDTGIGAYNALRNQLNVTENSGFETSSAMIGIQNNVQIAGSGDFSTSLDHTGTSTSLVHTGSNASGPLLCGYLSKISKSGTGPVDTATLFRGEFYRDNVSGTVSNVYGYKYNDLVSTGGTISVQRGFYSEFLDGATTNHDFYGEGPKSYFGGVVGINNTAAAAQLDVINGDAARVAFLIKAASSQSSYLFETRNSSSTLLSYIDNAGRPQLLVNGSTTPLLKDISLGKYLGVDLSSAASATSLLAVSNSAARTYTMGDDTGTLVSRTASVDLTAQTATIGSTTMYTSPHAGMYRVSIYAKTTTAGSGGDTVTVTIGWNDGTAQTYTTATLDLATLNAYLQDTVAIYSNSAAITYATTVAKAGSPQYTLRIRVEAI